MSLGNELIVNEILEVLVSDGLIEACYEAELEGLMVAYDIDQLTAELLFERIQEELGL